MINPVVMQCVSYLKREHVGGGGAVQSPMRCAAICKLRGQFVMGKARGEGHESNMRGHEET